MKKYSVLMSVYRKEKPEHLRLSIESMLCQTVPPDEMVIVEDGPLPKKLHQILEGYQKRCGSMFRLIPLEQNHGLGYALNVGLGKCRNELVARMDADDISLDTRCEKQLACFADNQKLAIVGTQIYEFEHSPLHITSSRVVPARHADIVRFARRRSPFNHPTVMYRRSKVLACGGYGTSGRKEDLDLFLTMLYRGCQAQNINEALLLYRADAGNLKRRKDWGNCSEYIAIIYKFYRLGFSSFLDLAYVVIGQAAIYATPAVLTKKLTDRFLRNQSFQTDRHNKHTGAGKDTDES